MNLPKIENLIVQKIKNTEQIELCQKHKEIRGKSNKTIFDRLEILYFRKVSEKDKLTTL